MSKGLFSFVSAAGDRVRPILWSPDIKRPKTEPSLSSKNSHDLSLPVLVGEPEKFKVRVLTEFQGTAGQDFRI